MSFFSNLFHGNSTGGNIFNALFDPAGITGIGNSLFPGKKKPSITDSLVTNAQTPTFNANFNPPQNFWSQGAGGVPQFNIPNFGAGQQTTPDMASILASLGRTR